MRSFKNTLTTVLYEVTWLSNTGVPCFRKAASGKKALNYSVTRSRPEEKTDIDWHILIEDVTPAFLMSSMLPYLYLSRLPSFILIFAS